MVNIDEVHSLDEQTAPEWLNETFFKEILKKAENDNKIKIINFHITPATSKNEHYASIIFRANIKYNLLNGEEKHKAYIIKTTPNVEGQKKNILEKLQYFETEIRMYAEALPKIKNILQKYGDETRICADIVYHSLQPRKCLIFEDLAEEGYVTIPNRYITIDEVKTALLKVAKLHAVSFKLFKEGDQAITNFKDAAFSSKSVTEWDFVRDAGALFLELLSRHEDLKQYIPHFKKIETKFLQYIIDSFNAYHNGDRDGIFVLNHGDFHMKNMIIKTKQEKFEDLILLDYQVSQFGSPAIDIIYACIMLFSPEMRLKHRHELIYYYFTNFQATLKMVEYKGHIPTMLEFQNELSKCRHWELMLSIAFLILNYIFSHADGDFAKLVEDREYRKQLWEKPEILNELKILLPSLLYRGCFEE